MKINIKNYGAEYAIDLYEGNKIVLTEGTFSRTKLLKWINNELKARYEEK